MEGSFQRSRALAPLEYFLTLTARTLQTTKQYQEFKTAGTEERWVGEQGRYQGAPRHLKKLVQKELQVVKFAL